MRADRLGILATLAIFMAPAIAFAQVIPPSEQPGRERERFIEPAPPRSQPGGPAVILPSTEAPAGAAQIMVTIRDVCIRGSTIYSKDDLKSLYADLVGQKVPLQAVYDLAKKITAKYGDDGYALSRAVVPPQQFSPGGAVPCLQVVEGYIDRVEWPAAIARYRDFFTHYATKIPAERPVNVRTIERYMLLAGDLPGLKFSASLKPSPRGTGASILVVELKEKRFDVLGRIDNRGTEARGPVQYQISANLNNALRLHESFNLTFAAATEFKELQYYAAGYRQVLTAEGLWWFVNASHGPSRPGTAVLQSLDYKSITTIVESGAAVPIIRSREKNLTLTGLAFASESTSDMLDGALTTVDRLRGVRVKADADFADRLLGINQINLAISQGFDGLGSTGNDNPNPSRAAGKVDFTKVEASVSRTQPLPARFSLFGSVYGQYAATPLLSPEQCGYGGRFYGRAYDPSELLGDHCVSAVGEIRYDIPGMPSYLSQLQLYGFGDWGKVWVREAAAGTPAEVAAASAGGGVRAAWLTNAYVDLTVAKAVAGPRDDTRFFFSVTGRY
jgi:hemolysin activation/secretion protein